MLLSHPSKSFWSVIALASLGGVARAQPDVRVHVSSSVTDASQSPGNDDHSANDSHVGNPSVLTPDVVSVNSAMGGGVAAAVASGSMGQFHSGTSAGYTYVIRGANQGGSSSAGSTIDIDDFVTVSSPTLASGTLVSIALTLSISGGVTVPSAGQARPGIDAVMTAYMRGQGASDDQLRSISVPQQNLHDLTATLQARVGETFSFRYGIDTISLLSSDIPDYRSAASDFSAQAFLSPQDPQVVLTAASGYSYLPCAADFDHDGTVDFFDYDAFVVAFEAGTPAADFDHDGTVDFFDYDAFVVAFEAGC